MLEDAVRYRTDVIDGRWVIETKFRSAAWEVIVEPKSFRRRLTVVTAYPLTI